MNLSVMFIESLMFVGTKEQSKFRIFIKFLYVPFSFLKRSGFVYFILLYIRTDIII